MQDKSSSASDSSSNPSVNVPSVSLGNMASLTPDVSAISKNIDEIQNKFVAIKSKIDTARKSIEGFFADVKQNGLGKAIADAASRFAEAHPKMAEFGSGLLGIAGCAGTLGVAFDILSTKGSKFGSLGAGISNIGKLLGGLSPTTLLVVGIIALLAGAILIVIKNWDKVS